MNKNRKIVHPNKLVNQYEEYIQNKNLAIRVRTVKPTINKKNDYYEQVLLKRQQREALRTYGIPPIPIEEVIAYNKLYMDPGYRLKTTDTRIQNQNSNGNSSVFDSQKLVFISCDKVPKRTAFPSVHRYLSKQNSQCEVEISSRKHNAIPRRGSSVDPRTENRRLQSELITKNIELELLKEELKDWWHEDYKAQVQPIDPNKNKGFQVLQQVLDVPNRGSIQTRGPVGTKKSTLDELSLQSNTHNETANSRDMHSANNVSELYNPRYKVSIPAKRTPVFGNKKKLAPIDARISNTSNKENIPTEPQSHLGDQFVKITDLKLRASHNLESFNKTNRRYQNEESDNHTMESIIEKEKEDQLWAMEPNQPEFNTKKQGIRDTQDLLIYLLNSDVDDKDDVKIDQPTEEASSPEIIVTSKTLMRQSRLYLNL